VAEFETKRDRNGLFGAAVIRLGFELRGSSDSPAFRGIFPGVLRDLGLTEQAVDRFIAQHRTALEAAARGAN
jgi:hypothetical protein